MKPRFEILDRVDRFLVGSYLGHTDINPRNARVMAKPQHWYECRCRCGATAIRSQQELIDIRRVNACADCRHKLHL